MQMRTQKALNSSLLYAVAKMQTRQSPDDFEQMPEERKSLYYRISSTAIAHCLFIRDALSCAVMDVVEDMKKEGLYRHMRKKYAKHLMEEVSAYEKKIVSLSGADIELFAIQNETFNEQIHNEVVKEYVTIKNELDRMALPHSAYLARIHQTKVICMAAMSAVRLWTEKMDAVVPPTQSPYSIESLKPKQILHWLNTLGMMEFSKFEDSVVEHPELPMQADKNLAKCIADTNLVCNIMEGKLKPSWMQEDENEMNKPTVESVKEEEVTK